jgi:ribonuclease HI
VEAIEEAKSAAQLKEQEILGDSRAIIELMQKNIKMWEKQSTFSYSDSVTLKLVSSVR